MKLLITQEEFENLKTKDTVPLQCENCNKIFYQQKNNVLQVMRNKNIRSVNFCSTKCFGINKTLTGTTLVNCKQCNKEFRKHNSKIKKFPNHFCCSSCSAIYNNKHKTTGYNRSKLEKWLETKLKELYPNLEIIFNDRKTVSLELDIYIPSLKLAFELNGIFHYEPIYGEKQFNKIQTNDTNKFQGCQQLGISLCIIDISKQNVFREQTSQKYLDIITNIIKQTIAGNKNRTCISSLENSLNNPL